MAKTKPKRRRKTVALEPKRWHLAEEPEPLPPLPPRFAMERALRRMQFGEAAGGGESGRERAQGLAYRAMEARDMATALSLAVEAIEAHPGCVDALLVLDDYSPEPLTRRVEMVRGVVETAAEELGTAAFERSRGHFWADLETRPYMRARERLAALLHAAGRTPEAMIEYEGLLDLNPNDNQACRSTLLGLYLEEGRPEDARRLLERYEGDAFAGHAWGRVLERFLSSDPAGAEEALGRARERNRHAEDYLLRRRVPPARRPDYYTPGQESEAWVVLEELGAAWKGHPAAVDWLRRHSAGSGN